MAQHVLVNSHCPHAPQRDSRTMQWNCLSCGKAVGLPGGRALPKHPVTIPLIPLATLEGTFLLQVFCVQTREAEPGSFRNDPQGRLRNAHRSLPDVGGQITLQRAIVQLVCVIASIH